jgi:RNA polymerase sigma factor (sigma-70 family)
MAVVISDRLLESSDRLLDAEPDDHLVSLVQTGHEAAFAAIVRRYERELQAHAHRLSSDGRGEDVVQQAFLNAFSALQNGSEVRHLRGWLHQILRNEVTRARVPIDAPLEATVACGETLEDTVARRATAHAALAELSALPDRQRDALLGTAVFGFPRAHVARTMGLSEGAVRQLVHRARLRLRQAASALIPFPLVKFFGAARSGVDAGPDAALGTGTAVSAAASGGLAIKVGALLTSGLLATGIAVTHSATSHHHAAAPAVHHAGSHGHGVRHVSPASIGPASVGDRVSGRGSGGVPAGDDERVQGGSGRLSGNRSGRHLGSGSGRGRVGGQGHDGSTSGSGDDGSGRSSGGTSGRGGDGSSGSPASSGSGSGSGSRSGSGSGDADGSGGGHSGSGSSGGRQGGSGSGSGSVTGTAASGSDSGAGSSDGGGSGRSSSGGGATSSSDDDTSVSEPSGSSGSTPSGSDTGAQSSGSGGGSQGGSDQANVASLGSDGAQAADSGSGSGSGKENSHGARDLSGATHSSSS